MRRSGPASTRMDWPSAVSTTIEGRHRRSRGSSDRQVVQSQTIMGTPGDVPVPRKVTFTPSRLDDPPLPLLGFHEAQPQLVEEVVDHLLFGLDEIAAGLLLEERDELNHLRRGDEIRFAGL